MSDFSRPFVSIVMPALNEQTYIAAAIESILPVGETLDYELIVMDGGSIDATGQIVGQIAATNPRVKLLQNPRRTQSAAINIAAGVCDPRSTILIRADCHALYPPRFVENCVAALSATGSASVVVPMRAVGISPLQCAIAAAQNSLIGNGGSRHRRASASGYVEHGHHAAFDRYMFQSLGGYDETAAYNEDAEFDARLAGAGGRIYLDGRLMIDYYPRSSFSALARQYYRHGWGRANTLLKHAMNPKLRQILPIMVLLACLLSFLSMPLIGAYALLIPIAYVATCLLSGLAVAAKERRACLILSGPAAMIMHMSWAMGFLRRLAENPRWRRRTSGRWRSLPRQGRG